MTNSNCLNCGELMHYSEFKYMENEEKGVCERCYQGLWERFLTDKMNMEELEDKFYDELDKVFKIKGER